MPSSLVSATIRGIRSYSPREDREQVIEFMPLTLIVGSNGTGKTSIIESLRFIIAGSEPPHSDSRRNFIHEQRDNKMIGINNHEYGSIELKFKDTNGNSCIAKRVISRVGVGKTTTPATTSSYKIGLRPWVQVHRQDDWAKIIPQLFGLPNQAILNSVILCHQEDNLWCMGDSSAVKLIFDKIFGCEQYKKEMKYIDDEIKNSKKDQQLIEKDLDNLRFKVIRKDELGQKIETLEADLRKIATSSIGANSELETLVEKKNSLKKVVEDFERRKRDIEKLRQRVKELTERDSYHKRSLETFAIKRPAPKTAPPKQQVAKKPALDPTADDLEAISVDFAKMLTMIDGMSSSDDLINLKKLVENTLKKVDALKKRFGSGREEAKPPVTITAEDEVEEVDDIESQIRKFRENVEEDIKKNLVKLEEVRSSLETIQAECDDESVYSKAQRQLESVDKELMEIRDQRSRMSGSKMQMERELESLKRDLESYRKVNFLYSESLGRLVCNKIILGDLEKLKACFHDSITNFHEQMIIKINELLRRRWKLIYQGADIESIELVAEEITRGKDKKSYNYYMAMSKNNKRMKMKEKSSAGQRALAAIILRMTLAELFVRDFAFIALDEPTANLDLANVQALARSIGAYVRKRKKLGIHVQWIIITHDEQFLRALDEECSPYFYRIKMDPTDKCSNIVKISCHESGYMPKESTDAD